MRWAALAVVAACAHDVRQDAATGKDGRQKGAIPIALDHGEGRARGIVTYPGGDRVDWKSIALPAGTRGTLDVKLTWRPPRPGLQVAFDMFDQWNQPVAAATRGRQRGRTRVATIANASGTYYIRVYAPGRGDAGTYELRASFDEARKPPVVDPTQVAVSDPPKLPAIELDEPAAAKLPAPTPPPPPAPAPPPPPPTPPTPPPVVAPVIARIISISISNSDALVTVTAGSERGVAPDWRAEVLGANGTPVGGMPAKIIRVDKRMTVVRVRATFDQVNANLTMRLSPP